ncbi:MAG: PDZ domain-containing protein [Acidobacteria bacterium]|nr:PDZ domain-containing protein [Acidobacteriota bacterium]
MLLKGFSSILIVTSSFVLAMGQTPEAKKDSPKAAQTFAFTFDGDGGYLGVQSVEVTKENFAKFGLREVRGVAVDKVMEGSPAAAAGIKDGDVIVRFNGEDIASTRKLTRLVSETSPDHQVKLTVVRNGSEQEITATLGKRPMPKFGDGNFSFTTPPMGKIEAPGFQGLERLRDLPQMKDFPKGDLPQVFMAPNGNSESLMWRMGEGRQIGVGVSPLTKQLAQHFGVESGVLINEVRENSPAAKAGLKAGDIIVEIDGKAAKGDFDLIRAINAKKEGDVSVTFVRDGKRQTVSITPEASKDAGFLFRNGDENGSFPTPPPAPMRMATPATPFAPNAAPPSPVPAFFPGTHYLE